METFANEFQEANKMARKDLSFDAITAITDSWYNQLSASLRLPVANFQLLQPLAVLNDDQGLWDCFNAIPPETLKYNRWFYQQPTFFSQYAGVVNELTFPDSAFANDIGAATYAKWTIYLNSLPQPPPANALPTVWFQWAMVNAPEVANIGRSDLSCQLLINSGQAVLAQYEGADAKPVDFLPSFSSLQNTLRASAGASFSFDSTNDNPDVSNSWVPGYDPNYFGLWTGSSGAFQISKKFALSHIAVSISFAHYTVVPITPGVWYNSGLLHLALVSLSAPPWTTATDWNAYFADDGTFNYAEGSALAVDGITLNLTSDADFSEAEQSIILSQAGMGYWPLYCREQSAVISNKVTFESGKLTIQTQSSAGNPILLGANVFGINQYLGGS